VIRLARAFEKTRTAGESALVTYVMGGDPDLDGSLALARACLRGGADLLELGMPFSDPIADGPVIQRAAQRALASGTTVSQVLTLAGRLRAESEVPLVLMGYVNPVLALGERTFLDRCVASGVDAVILPDLPPEEAGSFTALARERNVATVFLLAPTSTPARVDSVFRAASGFVYFVSVTGVTGARRELPEALEAQLDSLRGRCPVPLVVGFGVARPEQAARLGPHADGVVVGSVIVEAGAGPGTIDARARAIEALVSNLKGALRRQR
jgi:tryptophan synthase alpha chain